MYKKLNALLALLFALALVTSTAVGQVTGGAVTGLVVDAQGR